MTAISFDYIWSKDFRLVCKLSMGVNVSDWLSVSVIYWRLA